MSEILSEMYIGLRVQYPLFLSDFNETYIFSIYFRKILQNYISWQTVRWKPIYFKRTGGKRDRQTDRHDEANRRFS